RSLMHLLHYAEHTAANLTDAVTYFEHVLAIVFADGNVSKSEFRRLEEDGARVAQTLRQVYNDRTSVNMPDEVQKRVTKDAITWEALIGPELHLHPPKRNDFASDWINIAASWWSPYIGSLNALATHVLDVLIETEETLMQALREGRDPGPAPLPAGVPTNYPALPYGQELKRQERLGWWDRFQVAEGFAGGAMRFVVAAAVLAPAFMVGLLTAQTDLYVYNGTAQTVVVSANGNTVYVMPDSHATIEVPDGEVPITTTNDSGQIVEQVTSPDLSSMAEPIYNVQSARPLIRYWAAYGSVPDREPEVLQGTFIEGDADHIFTEPPSSVSTSSGSSGTYRSAIAAPDIDPAPVPDMNGAPGGYDPNGGGYDPNGGGGGGGAGNGYDPAAGGFPPNVQDDPNWQKPMD
ncbi:MAG: hypothetical protein AAF938_22175, partial [Myxococcota bacterium]